ncbi:MAG TPA: clostripain-related cysteine peptidase [Myxococcales bacterium]
MRSLVACLVSLALLAGCGGSGQTPADSGATAADAAHAEPPDAAVARGAEGEPCREDGTCNPGLECGTGSLCAQPAGDLGEPCLPSGGCHGILDCVSSKCLEPIPLIQGLTATGEDYAISLAWTWSGDASARFDLVRRRQGEPAFEKLASLSAGTTTYLDEAIELGIGFEYSLTAIVGDRSSLPCAPVLALAKVPPKEWTLIYFIASDGDYGYTYWFNVDGLQQQGGTTAKVNAIALYDGFDAGDSKYLVIGDSNAGTTAVSPPRAAGGEVNMGELTSYTDLLDWLLPRYSARHYLISFHDHGGGAVEPKKVRNMLYDQSSADSLDPDEQGQVVAYLAKKIGRKVDVVESMTCLGQMAENTWGMRDSALFHVGAESLSYVTGTYPLTFLEGRPTASAEDVALFLAQDHADGIVAQDVPCTWSAVDLGKLGALGTKLGTLASQLKSFATTDELKARLRITAGGAQNFSYQAPDLMAAYLDIKDLAVRLAADASLPADARATAAEIVAMFEPGGLVLFNSQHSAVHPQTTLYADYTRASGLSIYHPNQAWPFFAAEASPPYPSLSFSVATGWADYLQSIALPMPSGKCPAVTDLAAEKNADGTVTIRWSHATNQQACDAFYCSRDLNGKFTGVYQSVSRLGEQTSFTVSDAPTTAGTYTWRVSAFRGAEAESVNWSTSAPLVLP